MLFYLEINVLMNSATFFPFIYILLIVLLITNYLNEKKQNIAITDIYKNKKLFNIIYTT